MSSVGIFRKVEIDEKPYWVYSLTQSDDPTSSGEEAVAIHSSGDDLQPLFLCPRARKKFARFEIKKDDDVVVGSGGDDDDDGDDDVSRGGGGDDDDGDDDNDDGGGGGGDDDDDDDGGDDDDDVSRGGGGDDDDGDDDNDDGVDDDDIDGVDDDDLDDDELLLINTSPHFPSTRSGDQQGRSLLDCDQDGICKLPVLPLFWCNNQKPNSNEFYCGACREPTLSTSYYACLQCKKKFHKECVESPLEIIHPSHPFHSLGLYSTGYCIFYHCTICDLDVQPTSAMESIPFVVDHPKSHPHPLTFFPRQSSLVCSVCGTIQKLDPTYICIECVFAIHKDCIGFPHVIRISRHHHRISFTSSLPPGDLSCGVCHLQVDNDYGAYSCSKGEAYFVHSKCALQRNVWDGKDLDGVPEEDDMIDDGEPFKRIDVGIILHPFHSHNLRLGISSAYDEKKYCRGCGLPIYEGHFYSCIECDDFILHESCASAPRMKRHPLNPQPLTLKVAGNSMEDTFNCDACCRQGTGFFYEFEKEFSTFQLDVPSCASITEPFQYQGHNHPLFLVSDPEKEEELCQLCKFESDGSKLNCMECDYMICFSCLTFPYKARYKHDSHFLTICDGKEASDQPDWCEVCQGKIEQVKETGSGGYHRHPEMLKTERRYYKCNDCSTALHVECLLGKDIYMTPCEDSKGKISPFNYLLLNNWLRNLQILLNNSLSRPICHECRRRCPFPIFYKVTGSTYISSATEKIFCSWNCIPSYLYD